MQVIFKFFFVIAGCILLCNPVVAKTTEYSLLISQEPVKIAGKSVSKITVNHTIPGPTLFFNEGDDAVIHVTNRLAEDTSVHWHGLLLPNGMDGVPGLGGFKGIKPGETFTYQFKIRQSGTYWYHAHSAGQEQDGHYGSLVIHPMQSDAYRVERDYVVLLSDFSHENAKAIMSNLKMSSDYYQYARRTIGDFLNDVQTHGFKSALDERLMWGKMRMLPTDLSDVSGYTFLINGQAPEANWTGLFKPRERVRLRFINASAMTFFDVRIPKLQMQVISSDGQNIEPLVVDEFRMAPAETYDVIVSPQEAIAYSLVAEPIDRAGFAIGTLAPALGMQGQLPQQRPRAQLTMADMAMADMGNGHSAHGSGQTPSDSTVHTPSGHEAHTHHDMQLTSEQNFETGVPGNGWATTHAPAGTKALAYQDMRYLSEQKDTRLPEREIEITLGGNMQRYIWTLDGKKYADAKPVQLKYGERVRLKFINETMMAHPMHLHGMFVQLENGQPVNKLPNKHTVIVAPGDTYSVLLTADEPGQWVIHCHLLYHMMSGMMNQVVVAELGAAAVHDHSKMLHEHHQHDTSQHGQHVSPELDNGEKHEH